MKAVKNGAATEQGSRLVGHKVTYTRTSREPSTMETAPNEPVTSGNTFRATSTRVSYEKTHKSALEAKRYTSTCPFIRFAPARHRNNNSCLVRAGLRCKRTHFSTDQA